jgi:hypothetical protein
MYLVWVGVQLCGMGRQVGRRQPTIQRLLDVAVRVTRARTVPLRRNVGKVRRRHDGRRTLRARARPARPP